MNRLTALGFAAVIGWGAASLQQAQLAVSARGAAGAPTVIVGPVLADEALAEAVESGLPLRLRFRVELWRDALFDQLVDQRDWTAVLGFEPLERRYLAGDDVSDALHRVATYGEARALLERSYHPGIRAPTPGRYYYLATLEIETLSLTDLDELERWLGGELEPAVRGRQSLGGAIGGGLKRLLIRVLDLPARRFQARSDLFRVS